MSITRKPDPLTADQIADIADKSEGKKPKKAEKFGRPTEYTPELAKQVERLCEFGATEVEIADFFEVSPATVTKWKNTFPEFLAALRSGKDLADERVQRSLYHKAIGYTFDAVKIFQYEGTPVVVPYREHIPPDTTACIFWLKNRRAQQWRDVWKLEHGAPGEFDGLTVDQLREKLVREATEAGARDIASALTGGTGKTNGSGRLN